MELAAPSYTVAGVLSWNAFDGGAPAAAVDRAQAARIEMQARLRQAEDGLRLQLRDAARYVPLDRLLVETDSPYLAPVPHRGKENQPALVRDVAEYMAVLKGVSLEQLAQQTTDNFATLFHIDPARLQPA